MRNPDNLTFKAHSIMNNFIIMSFSDMEECYLRQNKILDQWLTPESQGESRNFIDVT